MWLGCRDGRCGKSSSILRTIQWLLGLGGVLLVLGLVIWLATLGIFKEPLVVAAALGLGNPAVLAGGWATIRLTRYQTAGRAITLLACLVMPSNLWFYHANGLVTLEGHLWVAAPVCCVLYLASALVLRDPLFVYVLCGHRHDGPADARRRRSVLGDRLAGPLSVVLGLISVHAERAFPEVEGTFSRQRFGLAFFLSGHVLMAAGLLLILGAEFAGDWLYRPVFQPIYERWHLGPPAIVAEARGDSYSPWGWFWQRATPISTPTSVVRRVGLYVYLAVFTLLWAEILLIQLLAVRVTTEAAIMAGPDRPGGQSASAATAPLAETVDGRRYRRGLATTALSLVRAGQPLGLFLSTVPVLLGLILHLRATYRPLNHAWCLSDGQFYAVFWTYVVAMLITAVSCRIVAASVPPLDSLALGHLLLWHGRRHAAGPGRAAFRAGHPCLGRTGPAGDDRPDRVPDRRPAVPRTLAGAAAGVGRPRGDRRDDCGRVGCGHASDARTRVRGGGRQVGETPAVGGLFCRGGLVLCPGRRVPQARPQRVPWHADGLRAGCGKSCNMGRFLCPTHARSPSPCWAWHCWLVIGWPCWNGRGWSRPRSNRPTP